MSFTPKYRWNRMLRPLVTGLSFGFAADVVGLAIAASLPLPDPPHWAILLIVTLAVIVVPGGLAALMIAAEMQDQMTEYRAAVNQCQHCGYPLRGIRRISNHCPECGKPFKKT